LHILSGSGIITGNVQGNILPLMPFAEISQAQQAVIAAAFIGQFLKELGIPSPGITQSSVVYAGYLLTLGNPAGIIIIGVVLAGFVFGSAASYCLGYFLGGRLAPRVCRLLRLRPEQIERARSKIAGGSRWTVFAGRFVPAMALPLSLAAGAVKIPLRRFYAGVGPAMAIWIAFFAALGAAIDGVINEAAPALVLPPAAGIAAAVTAVLVLCAAAGLLFRRRAQSAPVSG
jgi:membrane protein DedA with SNARE-associated domain